MKALGRVLVTGGSGFIGRHLLAALEKAGVEFDLLLRPSSSRPLLPAGTQVIEADMGEIDRLADALDGKQFDQVVHLAGALHGRRSDDTRHDEQLERLNHRAPVALLEALAPRTRRFIRLGSLLEYGPSTQRLQESSPEAPTSAYGRSLLAGTRGTHSAGERLGIEVLTLRPSLVYGPGMGERTVLGWSWTELRQGRTPELLQPAATRDLLFVEDLVDAILRALRSPEPLAPVLNLGSGYGIRIDALVAQLAQLMERPQLAPPMGGETGEADSVVADPNLARAQLAWKPERPLRAGLEAFLASPTEEGPS